MTEAEQKTDITIPFSTDICQRHNKSKSSFQFYYWGGNMDLKKTYFQLTNVEIEKQKLLWDERGKGYYGEFLLFCELFSSLNGNSKILMNLNIPVSETTTTEIDLLLIHETGFYVFEVKHYKGTIYGNSSENLWTQYFRTAKNQTFKNPVFQNNYHINALKKLYPSAPIHSFVVFTNKECEIKIKNSNSQITICCLHNVIHNLSRNFHEGSPIWSMEKIDEIFGALTKHSPIRNPITIDGETADFYSWLQPIISKLEEKKIEAENEKNNWIEANKNLKSARRKASLSTAVFAVLCFAFSLFCIFGFQKGYEDALQKNNDELAAFKQNFLHIDEINNEYIDDLRSYVSVSNVSLLPLTDDAVSFSATLAVTNDIYGIQLTQTSRYIVMTKDGRVFEYNVFGPHLSYSSFANKIATGIRSSANLATIPFYGISDPADISYIKITDISLFKTKNINAFIKENLEIELYAETISPSTD